MTAEGNQHNSLEFRWLSTFLTKHYLISEVGDKLTEVLKLDKSGGKAQLFQKMNSISILKVFYLITACYVVFPDCPLVDFPNLNSYWVYSMIMFGQWFATPLGMKSFGMTVFIAFFLLIMVVIFLLFLSILF